MTPKAPFLIQVDWTHFFACGSAEAVKWFLSNLKQPVDPSTVRVSELIEDGTYQNRLLDLFK